MKLVALIREVFTEFSQGWSIKLNFRTPQLDKDAVLPSHKSQKLPFRA